MTINVLALAACSFVTGVNCCANRYEVAALTAILATMNAFVIIRKGPP